MRETELDNKIKHWQDQMLDLGKRNKMISFRDTSRSTLKILTPDFEELYRRIVVEEQELTFQRAIDRDSDVRVYSILTLLDKLSAPMEVTVGDIRAQGSLAETAKTLKNLRAKARLALNEQGTNILHLVFGFLQWRERGGRGDWVRSPLILAPVSLLQPSLNGQYSLKKGEDEVVVNPTLAYLLERDFGIRLPEFDPDKDSLSRFLQELEELVNDRGWRVIPGCSMGLVSFQKITMYHDLIRNEAEIKASPVIRAIAGCREGLSLPTGADAAFDHDNIRATQLYQVLDADSSQQDAIMLSRKGVSFVMQGPPGTGKSQTITNIIAQGLADGKKILFVSEKMAALEVVYNRLADVQLGDFCLNLHSHKANKKEILAQLSNNLELQWRKVKDEELAKLTRLDMVKEQLKAYAEDIHTTVMPLEMSLYEVYGAICSRFDLPDVDAPLPGAADMTRDQLNRNALLLKGLDEARQRLNPPLEENPWRGLQVPYLSPSRKQQASARLANVIRGLESLDGFPLDDRELSEFLCMDSLDVFLELYDHAGFCNLIPQEWFERDAGWELDLAVACAETTGQLSTLRERIIAGWGADFPGLIGSADLSRFQEKSDFFLSMLQVSKSSTTQIPESAVKPKGILPILLEKGSLLRSQLEEIRRFRENYRILPDVTDIYLEDLLRRMRHTASSCAPNSSWLTAGEDAHDLLNQLIRRAEDLKLRRGRITAVCEESVFTIPYAEMLNRFKTDYTSPFRVFSGQYREDMKKIRLTYRNVRKKISNDEVIELLQTLRQYQEDLTTYQNLANATAGLLGVSDIPDLQYDWVGLLARLDTFAKLCDAFSDSADALRFVEDNCWEGILNTFRRKNELRNWFVSAETQQQLLGMQLLLQLQQLQTQHSQTLSEARKLMPELFTGGEPDWNALLTGFDHMRQMKQIFGSSGTDFQLRRWLTGRCPGLRDDRFRARLEEFLRCREDLEGIISTFDRSENLTGLSLKALRGRLQSCLEYFTQMDSFIDYREQLSLCREQGLDDFLRPALKLSLKAGTLAETYLKRFYYAWFEEVSAGIPSVSRFRVHSHNENVDSFRALDSHRLPVDRMRIRERLIRDMPRKDHYAHGSDEMSVLLHELGKKRNIMPLRRLFRTIPNLLLRLKPCLMMSPLSVSYFLEAQTYKFDMVIFDEASQIFPQDAIGAIFRSKQVIITGDSKQLPPTNFFTASTSNTTGVPLAGDEDEYDENLYDSILEEASCNLPNRSLLWHYRSRYEDLISFSNREVYGNHLITFPSSTEGVPDTGVEYIHVPGGVYENRCNAAEARRIMVLVAEHIRNYPHRSLGVIAFSESQQTMIEEQITAFRTLNPELEWFFDENREEAFFVKNLENVQGDERDTIIFSICYGKNRHGRMYMRFGPLGATGGERRLNVAITRAKQNIKLVGSILPEDLDLSRTDAEGVRMLRDYIRFAMAGSKLRQIQKQDTDPFRGDSFCEEVGNYLTSMGCSIRMHVGSSDYTVDIAVEHPTRPGHFIAGIECDGEAYRAARTVRDRDHLRTAVLERMGWKMYRIWSTGWIQNPEAEQNRLMQFVRQALLEDGTSAPTPDTAHETEVGTEEISPTPTGGTAENPYNLPLYQEFDCRTISVPSGADPYALLTARARGIIQAEQPIHMDLLCRRLCVCFPAGKVTQHVRDTVDEAIRRNLSEETVTEDRFVRFRDFEAVQPRRSPAGSPHRSIDQISIPEISAAMVRILKNAYGMERNVLCNEVASVFGFERSGPRIRQRTSDALDGLVARGIVSLCEGKLQLLEDQS